MNTPIWPLQDPQIRSAFEANALSQIDFFRGSLNAEGGFDVLDHDGTPMKGQPQELHVTTRMVHSYALAHAWGASDCTPMIDAGMSAIWRHHRDAAHGGYAWSILQGAHHDVTKLAYGHVFVLLAASSAKVAGHDLADTVLTDIEGVIDRHFWDEERGLLNEEFASDWAPISEYRGMNANMHGAEAMLAAFEATGRDVFLHRAGRILNFFTKDIAPEFAWRIPEHYDLNWQFTHEYEGNPMFRPAGTTPGHALEFGRLLLQYRELTGNDDAALADRARRLIETALNDAWLDDGGLAYTVAIDGSVLRDSRYWWPVTEGIGALSALMKADPQPQDAQWFTRLWTFAQAHFIDAQRGGWYPEIGSDGLPTAVQFSGKPDIYHSLQGVLYPLCPGNAGMFGSLARSRQPR
ncbi:AGE family epimerase/isomerase [Roseicitreum antarcticum]|uniref:Mannose or cellobiose epimerase, N-acyl-D-glucosamine 2-epimerase family n=1 Tax=Roseicitreum antarcticum TaxID=564137 RepID=A0A1H2VJN6_9RHOB|nr:AGE family epimerase/isomerase [Roseicitreum antarcticum]SDW68523.1 Mannose or cellobiose epimerase, N-acyl-D-glucosamine 2-epimerase family [Roseicitreum antarcticum]